MSDFKDLDMMKNLSVVSLKDDIPPPPELKQMISNRLQSLSKSPNTNNDLDGNNENGGIKVPTSIPIPTKKSKIEKSPIVGKKRQFKEIQKKFEEYGSSTAETDKSEVGNNRIENGEKLGNRNGVVRNDGVSQFKSKKQRKRNKKKRNRHIPKPPHPSTTTTDQKFQNLVKRLKH